MGLKERRVGKEFQDSHYGGHRKAIEEALGFEVTIEVDWEALQVEDMSHLYVECWPKVYFTPLTEGFKTICADDMGKEALKEALKKIVITNQAGNSSGRSWVTFNEGVLKLDHKPTSNVDQIKERTEGLVSMLESSL